MPLDVVMIGRTPPPVTGMTVFTGEVLQVLRSHGAVDFFNWSVGAHRRTVFTRVKYIWRAAASLFQLLSRGRSRGERLYLMVNSDSGLYLTAALTAVAARLGYAVYLHHHVYNYIEKYDPRMAWIERRMGPNAVHIVACPGMMCDYNRLYHSQHRFFIIHPSAVAIELGAPRTTRPEPLRLGMLSNLSFAKGIDLTIETFTRLHKAGRPITLTLAGPALDSKTRRLVEQAATDFPGRVNYLGPLYDDDKSQFFRDIDVFLFPTQRESWGIVLHEALAEGVPVIANERGCTALVVGDRAGRVVPSGADFAESAASQVERWLEEPREYVTASRSAIEQADFLNAAGRRTLKEFAVHMYSPPGSTGGLIAPR